MTDDTYPPERLAERRARESAPQPTEPIGTARASIGIVKYWRAAKGYGAISCTEVAPFDIWCHFGTIEDESGFRDLTQGETVSVDFVRVDRESFKYVATRVRRQAIEDPNNK